MRFILFLWFITTVCAKNEKDFPGKHYWSKQHTNLCKRNITTTTINPKLKCYTILTSGIIPSFVEVYSFSPPVVIFRNVLFPQFRQKIIDFAKPRATRQTVQLLGVPNSEMKTDYRVANGTFINTGTFPDARSIMAKIERLTNVDPKYSEQFSVLFYRKYGHYAVHNDFLKQCNPPFVPDLLTSLPVSFMEKMNDCKTSNSAGTLYCFGNWVKDFWLNAFRGTIKTFLASKDHAHKAEKFGDRIATFLIYLKTPKKYGGTIFPNLNLVFTPNPGDALFWFNARPDGTEETLTEHAGCPVTQGSKVIVTSWIRERHQELKVKCPLENTHYEFSSFDHGVLGMLFKKFLN